VQAKAAPAKPKGLASSRFAEPDEGEDAAAKDDAAEGEDDYSSVALATVGKPFA
jgi:hypothetical protein